MSARRSPAAARYDAVVVGGSTAGLVLTYLLGHYGQRTLLLEKSPHLGGTDRSFENRNGRRFDFGLHVLDHLRSEFTTRLYEHVIGDRYNRVKRRRAIVLEGQAIGYNRPAREWPAALRGRLPPGTIHDRLNGAAPSRSNLAPFYGEDFVNLIFDRTLPSYPSECWHARFGVDESDLMTNIYPWFFPAAVRGGDGGSESARYQAQVRQQATEYLIYPKAGGFGAFVEAFRARLAPERTEVLTGIEDLEFDWDPDRGRIRSIRAHGRDVTAQRVFWCAPAPTLCALLGVDAPNYQCDRFLLGSFELDRPACTRFNELIVGDVDHRINRLSFPGQFAGEENNLVQVEFCYPIRDEARWTAPAQEWRDRWLESLKAIGLVEAQAGVSDFDLKTFPIRFNAYGVDGQRVREVTLPDLPEDSNLVPVLPEPGNVNINTRVPKYLRFLAQELTGLPTEAG